MRWCGALALCAFTACTEAKPVSDSPAPPQPTRIVSAIDSAASNSGQPAGRICTDAAETVALRCAQGAVVRRGDTLVFRDSQGRRIVRVSNLVDGEQYLKFTYFGRLARPDGGHLHVLHVQGYESPWIELIADDIGASVTVGDDPIPSPDGLRFAAAVANYETCEGRVELEVWRLAVGTPVREFTVAPFDCTRDVGWWPTDVIWHSADTLSFVRHVLATDSARHRDGKPDATNALLVRRATGWALDSASATTLPSSPSDSLGP